MSKQNKLIKKSVLPFALVCSALLMTPAMGGQAYADVQNVQQSKVVKGTVVDETGEPVIGATVLVVGGSATQGTVTDMDGNFSINVKPGAKVKITYIGYDESVAPAKDGMKVQLKTSGAVALNTVEVVAYGVQKKVTVTGALSSVKSEDLLRTPVASVNDVLAGQLSGVTTVQYSGEPGENNTSVFVRGKGTFGNANPLIQVDGVERDMYDIDPNEIESITVLKDASATAVFGVRGANGVVLITTKRGQEGKAKVSVSTSFSALTPTKMVEQASSLDYAKFYNMMCENDGSGALFSDAVIKKFEDGSDPYRFPSTDWVNYVMKDVTLQTQHNVSISGGTKSVRYFISAGMFTQGGLFKQFDQAYTNDYSYDRFNYRANLDIDLTKTTSLAVSLSGVIDEAKKPYTGQGSSGIIKQIYYATPFSSPGIIDGQLIAGSVLPSDNADGNSLPFIGGTGMGYYGSGFMNTNNNKLSMDLQLNQKLDFITKGLSWRIKGSYNSNFYVYKRGSATVASYTPVWQSKDEKGQDIFQFRKNNDTTSPAYSESRGKGRNWYFETAFNYNRTFGLHSVGALLLYNQSKKYYPSEYSDIPEGYVGLVGRVTYDWNNRYMAEFNVGYNGSENFAEDKRFGFFPAGSVGWVMSDESFFKPLKKVVSFLKLRASWGLVGNDKFASSTGYRFLYTPDPYSVNQNSLFNRKGILGTLDAYGYNFGVENGTTKMGAIEASKHNSDVTWETAFKQDYGFDINFLNDRLRGTFDYFKEHRKDILVTDQTAPALLGFTLPAANLGEVNSWGYEVSLNWNDKIGKNFRYWVKANLSYNQNEIVEKKETPQEYEYQYQRGHRIGSRSMLKFWKYYYEGAAEDYKKEFGVDLDNQFVGQLKPGDCVYVDMNGDGTVNSKDFSYNYGYTDDPEYIAGLTLGFQWKGFTLNAQLTGAWNVTRMLSDVFRQPFYSASNAKQGGLLQYHVDNTWTKENPSQNALYPRPTWDNANQNYATSTLYEKDAKYLRLKTLMVSYDFKFPFMKTLGLNQLQLSLSGYNLLTFTPYKWGDPETRASNAPSYPLQRTYTASLKLGF